jgi:hypothetical protein
MCAKVLLSRTKLAGHLTLAFQIASQSIRRAIAGIRSRDTWSALRLAALCADVCVGSKAEITAHHSEVGFTPKPDID